MYPSIRSKFDQKLLRGLCPNKSATPITTTKARKDHAKEDILGRYDESLNARRSHEAKAISTIALKKRALPTMKGKKSESLTIKGVNNARHKATIDVHFRYVLNFISMYAVYFNFLYRVIFLEHLPELLLLILFFVLIYVLDLALISVLDYCEIFD